MKELAEKILYCLQMMNLIDWLTHFVSDDHNKRILARHILVYLDSFLELAPQLNNKIKSQGYNVVSVKHKLNQLRQDYEKLYSEIRDKLAVHRQDLPFLQRIEAWNEIDNTTVKSFINDALNIYNELNNLSHVFSPFTGFRSKQNCRLKNKLKTLNAKNSNTPKISSDNLGNTRNNICCVIPCNKMQQRCSQITSVLNTINFSQAIYPTLSLDKHTKRLGKAMIILDVFNLIDNLYPFNHSNPEYNIKSLLEICQTENLDKCLILQNSYNNRDTNTEDEFRQVRNKTAAHVDSKEILNNLLALLDSKDIQHLINKVFNPAYNAFQDWCQSDIATKVFLVDLNPEIKNVLEIEDLGGHKPYD